MEAETKLAETFVKLGHLAAAEQLCQQVLKKNPTNISCIQLFTNMLSRTAAGVQLADKVFTTAFRSLNSVKLKNSISGADETIRLEIQLQQKCTTFWLSLSRYHGKTAYNEVEK